MIAANDATAAKAKRLGEVVEDLAQTIYETHRLASVLALYVDATIGAPRRADCRKDEREDIIFLVGQLCEWTSKARGEVEIADRLS